MLARNPLGIHKRKRTGLDRNRKLGAQNLAWRVGNVGCDRNGPIGLRPACGNNYANAAKQTNQNLRWQLSS